MRYPQDEFNSRWNSATPEDQNWYVSRGFNPETNQQSSDPVGSPWQQYQRVLDYRGASLRGGGFQKPSAIAGLHNAGPRPWGAGNMSQDLNPGLSTDELIAQGRAGTLQKPPRATNAALTALQNSYK